MSFRCEDLAVGHPGRPAVSGLTFAVERGEVACVLGRNGAGKTTFFKTLLGALRARGGRAVVEGRDLAGLPPSQRACLVAWVPQSHQSPFPFPVLEMVALGGLHRSGLAGIPPPPECAKARAALESLGAAHLADRPCTELSGGELQRALLARALVQDGPVLLLDEPTAHLDWGERRRVRARVRALAAEGRAVLWTTHDPDDARLFADRVVVLHGGRMRACGAPRDILTDDLLDEVYGPAPGPLETP